MQNFLSIFKKWPSKSQWTQFFKVLTRKEKISFFIFFILALGSSIFLFSAFYFQNTKIVPGQGGMYTEGAIGQPRFINPIYANSDVDRDLVQLIFSGLMKYNNNLEIVPDLVKDYEIEDEGRIYTFHLREKIFWQDKVPLTSDDVIFTIKTIQNPAYKSSLQANWTGVEVEKINDLDFKLKLKRPYSAFLENCALKVLPKHIWENITPQNFPLTIYNLKPIGSGPYKLKEIEQDKPDRIKSITLSLNSFYFVKKPNISEVRFFFFDNEKELLKAAKNDKINGLSLNSPEPINNNREIYYLAFPRYFAVFFNQEKSKLLAEKEVRIALNYATNKEEIIGKILNSQDNSLIVNSPVLPQIYGLPAPLKIYEFNVDKAKEILEKAGFKDDNKDGLREKTIKKELAFEFKSELKLNSQGTEVGELQKCLARFPEIYPEGEVTNYFGPKTKEAVIRFQEKYAKEILEPSGFKNGNGVVGKNTRNKLNQLCLKSPEESLLLKFSLLTVDQPQLVETANLLKKQWEAVGAQIEVNQISSSQLEQEFIKPRNYDALLFGEVLGAIPDPLPFWHSSQGKDPGSNLSVYGNIKVDDLLEEIRKSSDPNVQAEKLTAFQDALIDDAPAVFLYSPPYIYSVSKEIKGVNIKKIADPSKRFSGIEDWYLKTKRSWK
jgi:peptide/nickel transport system substrate-binding protein